MKKVEVVCALIKNDNNEYLICKRGKGALEGYWEFPGGKIENSETKEEALIREIKEELKVDIEVLNYVGVSEYDYSNLEKPFSIKMYAYICKLTSFDIILTEHKDMAWVLKKDMHNYEFASADINIINML